MGGFFMVGTLFGLPLSQQFDANGEPLAGGRLKIFAASTTTPSDVYEDTALSLLQPWPLELDSAGRVPAFWLADGSYRATLTDADGVEIFDIASMLAIGPSVGDPGEVASVDATAVAQSGDLDWQPRSGTRSGWVRANARTIGSAASSATERANADCEDLYLVLWGRYADALCPVTGGRGASAQADFDANKPMGTLDMRGRLPIGLDDMGNSAAGVLTGVTTAAATGGDDTSTALLAHTHGVGSIAVGSHTHGPGTLGGTTVSGGAHTHNLTIRDTGNTQSVDTGAQTAADDVNDNATTSSDGAHTHAFTATTGVTAATTPSISGASASSGSGSSFSIMNPYMAGTFYLKL